MDPQIETRQVGDPAKVNQREKELLELCGKLLELLRITMSTSSQAYLQGYDLFLKAGGLPPEGPADEPHPPPKPPRKKKPKAPKDVKARWDHPELEGDNAPPRLDGHPGGGMLPGSGD